MKIKKTCDGCKAYSAGPKCDLGYKLKGKFMNEVIEIGGIPLEVCPKPKTYNELLLNKG